jgi:aconitase A
MHPARPSRGLAALVLTPLLASLVSACIYVPRTTEVYDADCRVHSRRMDLQPVQLAAIQSCSNSGCASLLVAAGATAAASAVISGSIVIVGNVVYWFEKQGACRRPG